MRALLVLVGLAALVVVGLVSFGLLSIQTKPGAMPSISVNGGAVPEVKADVARVSLGTENKVIEVPTIGTTEKTITVPVMKMEKPGDGSSNAAAAQ